MLRGTSRLGQARLVASEGRMGHREGDRVEWRHKTLSRHLRHNEGT